MSHRSFLTQLENFRREAYAAAQFVYADFAVNHAACESDAVLAALNESPRFWNLVSSSMQLSAYVTLGRIFDDKSKYNVHQLLDSFERELALFQLGALKARKHPSGPEPAWLESYLASAYYPTRSDVARIRKMVAKRHDLYTHMVKPARNKFFAHREKHHDNDVQDLFQRGTIQDLWLLSTFLLQLYLQLQELYLNGRKPAFRQLPYSVRAIYRSKRTPHPHQKLVAEVRELMAKLEAAPNNSFKPKPLRGSA